VELIVLVTEWLRRSPEFEVEPGCSLPIPSIFFDVKRSGRLPSLSLRWGA
jgi:hypothetical protein